MAPLSYQQSMTSGTRRIVPPHRSQVRTTSSMCGLCRSSWAVMPSSAALPTQRRLSHSAQIQIGSGVPQ